MTFDEYIKSVPEMSIPRKEFLREHWNAIREIERREALLLAREEFFSLIGDIQHSGGNPSKIVKALNKHGIKDIDHELRARKEE